MGTELAAYSYELVYVSILDEVGYVCVQVAGVDARLKNVGKYEYAACFVALGAAVHEVKGYVERVEVAVVGVVDEGTSVTASLDFETQGSRWARRWSMTS